MMLSKILENLFKIDIDIKLEKKIGVPGGSTEGKVPY